MALVTVHRGIAPPPPIDSVTVVLNEHEARSLATWLYKVVPGGSFNGPCQTISEALSLADIKSYASKEHAYGPCAPVGV